jgi:hypothetical protein
MYPAPILRTALSRKRAALVFVTVTLSVACRPHERELGGPFDHLLRPTGGHFLHVSSYDTTGGNVDRLEIAAGDSAVLLDVAGAGVIRRIWITVSSRDPHYLRRIALKMYWDGETTPSVSAPLGDFFGNGFDRRHYAALPMGVSSGGFYVYLPFPFHRSARIVAENGTGRTIDAFYYNIDLVQFEALPADVPTFHAWWHRDPRTTSPEPHLVLQAQGRGYFVGTSLNAESHTNRLWFLEGDEIFTVDGEFRGQGTGTEDYFNGGWYFDQGAFTAPYHGVVVKDDTLARIAAYRWHIPDPIPFSESVRVQLEHGHANQEVADYATMAYWYQTEPHAPLPHLPAADDRRVLSVKLPPGAVPAESLAIAHANGGILRLSARVPRPDRYEVAVYPVGGPDREAAHVRVVGGASRSISLDAAEAKTMLPEVIIDTVAAIDHLVLEVSRSDSSIAAVQLIPIRRWVQSWNVVGPFPNPQHLGTEYSPAVDSVYGPELDPDLDASYSGWGGKRVSWQRAEASEDGRVRLNGHFTPNDWVAAYAQVFLYSPDEQDASLLLGADDAHVLWVDGVRISERQGRHISVPDELEIPVKLRPGWNRVLLKVADLDGGWAFMLRAADPTAQLRWAPRP